MEFEPLGLNRKQASRAQTSALKHLLIYLKNVVPYFYVGRKYGE